MSYKSHIFLILANVMAKINVTLLTLLGDVVTDIAGTDIWNRDIESLFYFVFDTIV